MVQENGNYTNKKHVRFIFSGRLNKILQHIYYRRQREYVVQVIIIIKNIDEVDKKSYFHSIIRYHKVTHETNSSNII